MADANKKYITKEELATVETTWANLKTLRDSSGLTPGMHYRITDYVTTTTQINTQSAGHQFDIIVVADDVHKLNENARAAKHEGDTYFSGVTFEAWKIWYCLDNDTTRFYWADPISIEVSGERCYLWGKRTSGAHPYQWRNPSSSYYYTNYGNPSVGDSVYTSYNSDSEYSTVSAIYEDNGKGVIYRMIDEWDNDCSYDFKNIQFARWKITACPKVTSLVGKYSVSGLTDITVDTASTYYFYTFGFIDYNNNTRDASIDITMKSVRKNVMNYCLDAGKLKLPNNCCIGVGLVSDMSNNKFDRSSINNTFGTGSINNVFGYLCQNNFFGGEVHDSEFGYNFLGNIFTGCNYSTFGDRCYNNVFAGGCSNNTFGNDCSNNKFGSNFNNNIFGHLCVNIQAGNYFQYNVFGNENSNNTIGTNFTYNTVGSHFSNNSISNYLQYNTFGNNCSNNTFGVYTQTNKFGNNCHHNTFGNYLQYNTFENNCFSIIFGARSFGNTIGNDCCYINFQKSDVCYVAVEAGNKYINITSTQTTSPSNVLRNFTIAHGVNDSSTIKTISHDTVNDTFNTTYQPANSQIISV